MFLLSVDYFDSMMLRRGRGSDFNVIMMLSNTKISLEMLPK